MTDTKDWVVPEDDEWRLDETAGTLGFLFGHRCPCWVTLQLTEAERAACQAGGAQAVEALIAEVQRHEHRYRDRLSL